MLQLAATVFAASAGSRYVPLLLGLLIVSKQYMLATAALAPLLVPVWDRRRLLSFAGEAALVAVVATLPLAMLAPAGFWRARSRSSSVSRTAGIPPISSRGSGTPGSCRAT